MGTECNDFAHISNEQATHQPASDFVLWNHLTKTTITWEHAAGKAGNSLHHSRGIVVEVGAGLDVFSVGGHSRSVAAVQLVDGPWLAAVALHFPKVILNRLQF